MASFGDKLRLEREKGSLSVEEIAARTEIDPRFLRALEQDEFDALPGKAFGKFYIRAYAEILGFDPRTLISDYDAEQRRRKRPAGGGRLPGARPRRRVEAALEQWRASLGAEPDATPEETAPAAEPEPSEPPRSADEPAEPAGLDAPPAEGHEASPPSTLDPQTESESPRVEEDAATGPYEAISRIDADALSRSDPRSDPDEANAAAAPQDDTSWGPAGVHDEAAALATILGTSTARPRENRRRPVLKQILAIAGLALVAIAILALFVRRDGDEPTEQPVAVDPRSVPDAEAPTGAVLSQETADDLGRSEANSGPVSGPTTPSGLAVTELGVGSRIANHRLEGRAERFEQGSVVVFWTRVEGGSRGDRIRHVWLYRGRTVQTVPLELGGAHWRTFSRKTLSEAGEWAVEARDATDRVLARSEFVCVPATR